MGIDYSMSAQPDEHAKRAQELKEEGEQHLERARPDAHVVNDNERSPVTGTDDPDPDGADGE